MSEPTVRTATDADAAALAALERDANLPALAHVFPADEHPFPTAEVEARWRRLLTDPDVTVEVVDGSSGDLLAFVAYDEQVLRHLAVHPSRWRLGWGRALVDRAVSRMGPEPRLWCLVDNRAARLLYEGLGWQETGREQPAEWPPYPAEVEYVRNEPDRPLTASEE
ncbi:GNAT family N-acetyltransferase [Nocardioides sp.]|uniref:GNAT family N-acetyltransferase n=1 Tax=Nocardioides sp. TaxID=35761 RepID=UPI002ED56058